MGRSPLFFGLLPHVYFETGVVLLYALDFGKHSAVSRQPLATDPKLIAPQVAWSQAQT
ncbi:MULTISPECIES: hypothetical protein [unclassified Moorena]|uniref:Uncharacterized protein n=1 Tax=Moorena producens 3L TaxID=489825 RepID=F4Y339_9CYAN|nr:MULTISPECIES: hypothetical protein [unclassified Moorena]EGJ28515.1 hypothetical protein LYNGBM3L_72330 [Moorena producens 3L]NEP32164.1 hypothetical protein [Moorena sp. SIO3B2]NEQ18115.1 hypothetical protein [Moorena sp. SIO3E2]NES40464.1 hypothetical protein [Moorena sp. SIO2C4]